MVLLIGLRLLTGGRLPERRFEVYDRAVQLLLADHPQRRRVAAAVTVTRDQLSEREIRALLAKVAYLSQKRGNISTISENVLRGDLVAALSSSEHLGVAAASARNLANNILDIAEGELGLLVRKGPKEFGFLHRMLQEQLAAEHIADHMEPGEVRDLFAEHVGEPFWREVLLTIVWRTTRPTELRHLVDVIEEQVGEMPTGLLARELLSEVVFGQYGLPADVIQKLAPVLVDVAETHSYGTHRLRLMNAIFAGLNNIATRNIVETCVVRWAVLADRPTANLVWSAAQLPTDERLSMTVVRLLLLAIRQPDLSLAFSAAVSVIKRCSSEGRGSTHEREVLKKGLLELLADPPSGICQSAALAALALGWRGDPNIDCVLHEARSHTDKMVRLVALADAVGVLAIYLTDERSNTSTKPLPLHENERDWLLGRLEEIRNIEMHKGLLVTTIAQAVKGSLSVLEYLLKRMQERVGSEQELIWEVALKAFSDDVRVVDIVCKLLRSDERLFPLGILMGRGEMLHVYAPPSPHNSEVAQAVEDHLTKFDYKHRDIELFVLAAVDRGPIMKSKLLAGLKTSSFPHWFSAALSQYFLQDEDVKLALREVLLGDAVQASKVANAAIAVLNPDEVVQRLLDILRELRGRTGVRGRVDFVAHALIEACKANGMTSGGMGEAIASQAIKLMPGSDRFFRDPTYDLAVAFYPTRAAKAALNALAATEGHLVIPFLEAYREEPEIVAPFLDEAMRIIGSLPTQMRIRLCQLLSERSVSPDLVMAAAKRWADEVSERNKSYASLAYHRALIEARHEGLVSDEKWKQAKAVLGKEASCYGPDHESRRRAAWVGMSVLADWSMIEGLTETIGEPSPVGVDLGGVWGVPDIVLLQQITTRWRDLQVFFGDGLLGRLSGKRDRYSLRQVWAALSVVAAQFPEVDRELEAAVEEDSKLLKEESILLWFLSRPKRNPETAADALVASLVHAENNLRGLADVLIAEPERIGIDRNALRCRLESVAEANPQEGGYGNRPLEALAVAFPSHDLVKSAWIQIKEALAKKRAERRFLLPHPQTYIAVAYSQVSSGEVLKQLRRDLAWMKRTDITLYDEALTRHLSSRLRRDGDAAQMIADAIVASETPDAEAAELASLLSVSVPLSGEVLDNLERRLEDQMEVKLAPVVQDRVLSVSLSARTLLTRVIEVSGSGRRGRRKAQNC